MSILDTDCDPTLTDLLVVANGNSTKSVELVCALIGTASDISFPAFTVSVPGADGEDPANDLQTLYMGLAAAQANDRCLLRSWPSSSDLLLATI